MTAFRSAFGGNEVQGYTIVSLNDFAAMGCDILRSNDEGDFVVIDALQPDGQRLLCVQGVLRGRVLVAPVSPGRAVSDSSPALTESSAL